MKWIDLDKFPDKDVQGVWEDGTIELSREDLYDEWLKVLNKKKYEHITYPEIIQTINVLKFAMMGGMFNAKVQKEWKKEKKEHI